MRRINGQLVTELKADLNADFAKEIKYNKEFKNYRYPADLLEMITGQVPETDPTNVVKNYRLGGKK